jgi:hypothetical protein
MSFLLTIWRCNAVFNFVIVYLSDEQLIPVSQSNLSHTTSSKESTDSKSDDSAKQKHSNSQIITSNQKERRETSKSIGQMVGRCAIALLFIGKMLTSLKKRRAKMSTLSARVKVPDDILNDIWSENREFILEKYVFDTNYFNFIWNLINLYGPKMSGPKKTEVNILGEEARENETKKQKIEHEKERVKLVKREEKETDKDKDKDKEKKKEKKKKERQKEENQKENNKNNKGTTTTTKENDKSDATSKEPKTNLNKEKLSEMAKNSIKEPENGKVVAQNYSKESIEPKHIKKLPSFEHSSESSEESSDNEEKLEEYFRNIEVFEKKGNSSLYHILSRSYSFINKPTKQTIGSMGYRIRS